MASVRHFTGTVPQELRRNYRTNNINNNNNNNNNNKYILKQPDTDELSRRCEKESETIQPFTAACEQFARTEYESS